MLPVSGQTGALLYYTKTMSNPFQKASRSQVFLKLGITGVTGSGKSLSAMRLAAGLVTPGKRIAYSDTENDSASLYSDLTEDQCRKMKIPPVEIPQLMATSRLFDVAPIAPPYPSEVFRDHVALAVEHDYEAIIIDSASHFWKGILAYKDQIDSHGRGNSYTNWKQADQKFDPVIEAVLQSKIHVIFCMRSKMDYAQTEENGKKVVKKMGLAPVMRDGLEFEFTTVFDIGPDHTAVASKDRSGMFPTDRIFTITEDTGREFRAWLQTATPKVEAPAPEPPPKRELTEDEKFNQTVLGIRKRVDKERGQLNAIQLEEAWCVVLAQNIPDKEGTTKLEDFTRLELRAGWDNFPAIMEKAKELQNGPKAATA